MSEEKKEQKEEMLSEKMLETRSLIISNVVDSKLADQMTKQILLLEQVDPEREIKVFINSPGGEVTSGFAIFDLLKFVSCPVTTIVMGMAASMGSVLSLVGDKGRKFILPNGRIMVHQPLIQQAVGSVTDLEIQAEQILKTRQNLAELYAEQTGKSPEQILKDMDRDHWFTADEALEYGLVDKILKNRSELNE